MKNIYRKFILIHVLAFFILLMTWLCGEAIKTEAGSPFAALYYVLHIFPGSIIFILILIEWIVRNQGKLIHPPEIPQYLWINRKLHRAYYLILLALPLTGITVFFDVIKGRPFYQLHSALFSLLLILIVVNLISMIIGKLKVMTSRQK
jgi:cytochrome b561